MNAVLWIAAVKLFFISIYPLFLFHSVIHSLREMTGWKCNAVIGF